MKKTNLSVIKSFAKDEGITVAETIAIFAQQGGYNIDRFTKAIYDNYPPMGNLQFDSKLKKAKASNIVNYLIPTDYVFAELLNWDKHGRTDLDGTNYGQISCASANAKVTVYTDDNFAFNFDLWMTYVGIGSYYYCGIYDIPMRNMYYALTGNDYNQLTLAAKEDFKTHLMHNISALKKDWIRVKTEISDGRTTDVDRQLIDANLSGDCLSVKSMYFYDLAGRRIATIPVGAIKYGRNRDYCKAVKIITAYRIMLGNNKKNAMPQTAKLSWIAEKAGKRPTVKYMTDYLTHLQSLGIISSFRAGQTKITWSTAK